MSISKKDLKELGLRPLNSEETKWAANDLYAIGTPYYDSGQLDFWKIEIRSDRQIVYTWVLCYDREELARAIDLCASNYRNLKSLENAQKDTASFSPPGSGD